MVQGHAATSAFANQLSNPPAAFDAFDASEKAAALQAKDRSDSESEKPDPNDLAASVKSALLNPYRSPLYLASGYFHKVPTPFFNGDANDAAHGLFVDWRAGLKFLSLPEQTLELVDGKTQSTAFLVTSGAVVLRLPLYKDVPRAESSGDIEVALTGAINRIADTTASNLFRGSDPLIPKTVRNLHIAIGMSLPKLANIVVSSTLWSNTKLDKRFLISMNLQKDDEP